MQKRKMTCHHHGLPAMWGLKNAIHMLLFFDIALTMGSQRFFLAKIVFPFDLWRGEASELSERNGYMESGSEPGYTRPSHEDGTFTAANSLK